MIRVTLRNYDTNAEIHKFDYTAPRGKREGLGEALQYAANLQKEKDILGLGKPCCLKGQGFGLGISSITSKGTYSTTKDMEAPDSIKEPNCTIIGKRNYNEKKPEEVIIMGESNTEEKTGLRISASSYMCGLVLNTGRQYQGGFLGMGSLQPAYFIKFTSRNVHSGSITQAKTFDNPDKIKKYVIDKKDIFSYLVKEYGYSFSVEYICEEYKQDVLNMNEKKLKKWNSGMEELEAVLNEINNSGNGEDKKPVVVYQTEAAKRYAEWVNSGEDTPAPPEIGEEDMKAEALYRMERLGIWNEAIRLFKTKGEPMQSEGGIGILYSLDEGAKEAIEKSQKHGKKCVYAVIKTISRDLGTIYDLLYVSNNPEEWGEERCDKDGIVPSCCASDATFGDVEYGDIQISTVNGGLKRIG